MVDIKALFISDVHIGSKGCNAKELLQVLKMYNPEKLFIVGDFIDGWKLSRRHYWTQEYTNVIRKILSYSKNGTEVVYITGNHDDFLRKYEDLQFGNIVIVDHYTYNGYYITHGDLYDGVVKLRWLARIGSWGYESAMFLDRATKKVFGTKSSISKMLKTKVKDAVKFITNFENALVKQAKLSGTHGVICGHIHTPVEKYIDGIHYMNTGDWIENNSYIIEDMDGNFTLKYYS